MIYLCTQLYSITLIFAMITKILANSTKILLRNSYASTTAEKKGPQPAYLTPEAIKATLKSEQYESLVRTVEQK